MSKTNIVLLLIAAVLGSSLIAFLTSNTETVSFEKAFEADGKRFKVSGVLDVTQPIVYNAEENYNLTTFYMLDQNNRSEKVMLHQPKPQGLENSTSIDLYGKAVNGEFHANKMLMKCPSKYNESKHLIETAEAK